MKLLRVLGAMTLLALALLVAPSTANAAYGGHSPGVTVTPPSGGGGPQTITVRCGPGDTSATIHVTGNGQDFTRTEACGRNGKARFTVCLPAGTYHVVATDQDGNRLGSADFTSRGCPRAQGGPHAAAGAGGSLPNTGSNEAMTLGLIAGAVLLVGGAGFVVASRKRHTV